MSAPFVGEIKMFGGNFAPNGWAFCSGQILPISENDVLFTLIGTTYGGDGQETFALPNLQSRVPMHQGTGPTGQSYTIGEMSGTESETLTGNQIPVHTHVPLASSVASSDNPSGSTWAQNSSSPVYGPIGGGPLPMNPSTISSAGGSQPHDNLIPYLAVNYIISLYGIFPSQN